MAKASGGALDAQFGAVVYETEKMVDASLSAKYWDEFSSTLVSCSQAQARR
jgi:hypothetical protein